MALADPIPQPQFYQSVAPKRLLAWAVDSVLIFIISLLLVPFTAFIALFFFLGLMLTVSFVYRVITLAAGAATLGMRLFAIEFRNAQGQSP